MVTRVGVARETRAGERRVAAVPDTVPRLAGPGFEVVVARGAGEAAGYADPDYTARGAELVEPAAAVGAQLVVRVAPPTESEAREIAEGAVIVGLLEPGRGGGALRALAERGCSAYALELVPRISRAQACDALSSQALVSGYRSVIEAAIRLPRFFPMAMTAAGTVPPAKVFVLGAGVAGLQAIATARRLGAVVEANDVRAAAAEEVASLGARFVDLAGPSMEGLGGYARAATEEEIAAQRERLADHLAGVDVVITTAAVPGRPAPLLVTREMVERMRPGSVLVDLAAESGGNCEVSQPGVDVVHAGVTVAGMAAVPSRMARDASALYARNVSAFVSLLVKDGELRPDHSDEILAATCLLHEGEPVHPQAAEALGSAG